MALESQLLRGDPKLEAAAVSDPAHITPGATGEHVRKIQQALNRLDGARLSADGIYGPATAAAVLAYKQRRGIVNRSFQNTADNIVGKMTIAALDLELIAQENGPAALLPISPSPTSTTLVSAGPILAFKFADAGIGGPQTVGGPPSVGAPPGGLTDLVPAPVNHQVVIAPNRLGTVQPQNFVGGVLVLSEPPNPNTTARIAKLINGTNLRTIAKLDNADVVLNPETFRYQTFFECGIVKMQAVGPDRRSRRSLTSLFWSTSHRLLPNQFILSTLYLSQIPFRLREHR
jgi:peptidoglycan hydrolase-like protein with peptidoglycan-binding domain